MWQIISSIVLFAELMPALMLLDLAAGFFWHVNVFLRKMGRGIEVGFVFLCVALCCWLLLLKKHLHLV